MKNIDVVIAWWVICICLVLIFCTIVYSLLIKLAFFTALIKFILS